jgi:SAM-dependent methyltransferase
MLYLKNTDLAETYHVSLRTVLNWIEASKEGKLDLQLYDHNSRQYIANTTKNIAKIEQIVQDRKKYRNKRGYKVITPKPEFYQLFNNHQIIDIILALDTYKEVPRQYNYFDGGADYWDRYVLRLASEQTPNLLNQTVKLLDVNQGYFDELLSQYKRVNVIDLGVGNAVPIRGVLERLLAKGSLSRYIGLDISPRMLEIAEHNINEWFEGQVKFEGHQLDVNYDRFIDLLAAGYTAQDSSAEAINLIFFLGGTLENLRSPDAALKVIHNSMGRNDLFIQTLKLDSHRTRHFFDFSPGTQVQPLAPQYKFLVDLLGIDESYYEVEMGFNKEEHCRYLGIKLKVALSIDFSLSSGEHRMINFNKDSDILVWRYWHQGAFDVVTQLRSNDFSTILASQTEDQDYIMTVSRVNSN